MKKVKLELNTHASEATRGLIAVRGENLHISSVMLMAIVDDVSRFKTSKGVAYIGEVEAMYLSNRKKGDKDYSYGGICQMLRKLYRRGYLIRHVDGHYTAYSLSKKGLKAIDSLAI